MVRKIIKKLKEIIQKKKESNQPEVERRKTERRKGERRWMSKLVGGPEVPFERRSGFDRRMGDRRKK